MRVFHIVAYNGPSTLGYASLPLTLPSPRRGEGEKSESKRDYPIVGMTKALSPVAPPSGQRWVTVFVFV